MIEVLVRNADFSMARVRVWTDLTVTQRFNVVGSWQLTLPTTEAWRFTPGTGIVVVRDGVIFVSGQVESLGESFDADSGDGGLLPGSTTITGSDDMAWIADRETYADPAADIQHQTVVGTYVRSSGNVETLMRELVNLNAGPGALAARRVPGLTLGPTAGLTGTASFDLRGDMLMEALRAAAFQGGGIGFQVQMVGTGLQFSCFATRNLTSKAVFSTERGNLRKYDYTLAAPTGTRIHVAAQGVGKDRNMIEYPAPLGASSTDEMTWGRRIEPGWVDRRDTNLAVTLDKEGYAQLATHGSMASLTATVVDSARLRFGADDTPNQITGYRVGDLVTAVLASGVNLQTRVQESVLNARSDGTENVTSRLGADGTSSARWLVQRVEYLNYRLSRLERI